MAKERHKNIPAAYLFLLRGDQVLLLRRFNTGYADGQYSVVAGHVESGETFTQCILREAEEEVGARIRPENIRVGHVMHKNSDSKEIEERVHVFFVAEQWEEGIENKEKHKCDDPFLV